MSKIKATQDQTLLNGEGTHTPVEKEADLDTMQKALEADRQRRVKKCGEELGKLLEKYGCQLHSYQELIDGSPKGPAQIIIVAAK